MKRQCSVEVDVIGMVKRSTLRWFGHMERMNNERLTKRVYMRDVDGRRRRGRPRNRWKDKVREYMKEGGIAWEEGVVLTGDRGTWRSFFRGHPE